MNDSVKKFIDLMQGRKLWPPLNNYSFFGQGSAFNISKYMDPYYPNVKPMHLILIAKAGESMQVLPQDTLEDFSRHVFGLYLRGDNEAQKRFKNFDKTEAYVFEMFEKYTLEKIAKTGVDKLLKDCQELRERIWSLNGYIFFTLHFDKQFCLEIMHEEKYPVRDERFAAIWDKGITPAFESFDKAQRRYVLQMFADKKTKEYIIEHAQFIFTNYYGSKPLDEVAKNIEQQYRGMTYDQAREELFELDESLAEEEQDFKKWFKALSKEEQRLVWYFQRIINYRDRRKNLFAKAYVVWWRTFEKMFNEVGLDSSLIPFSQFDEMLKGVDYLRSIKEKIELRPQGSADLVEYDGTVTMEQPIDYEAAKKALNDFYIQSTTGGKVITEIKGQVGSPGLIRGRVRVILNAHKAESFVDGEILVAGMTRPEYVPLMKKASAIITDEGGITCHAAIVSRELKKPCVIGTKIATKVLKDGDMVEVDANNGIVKIIK